MFERFTEHAFNSKSQLNPYWAENSAFVKCESQLKHNTSKNVPPMGQAYTCNSIASYERTSMRGRNK
jgi:hypothetical protein